MYRTMLNDKEELVIYVDKAGEPCYTVIDHSKLFNRKKYFNTKTLDNPNYVRELAQAEKMKRMGKDLDKDIVFDSTQTIPDFNINHNIREISKEINKLIQADAVCYEELKKGVIFYAAEEIAELQHKIDKLENEQDKIDFMAGIQRKKRHAKYLRLIQAESENRKLMRELGYDSMSYFKLSYLSQVYVTLLYSWGYSEESIEAFMGLKNGYLNRITKHIEQEVKRELIIELEPCLAWKTIKRFEQLTLSTGRNLTKAQIEELQAKYRELRDRKAVEDALGYSAKTVKKWVDELLEKEPWLVAEEEKAS